MRVKLTYSNRDIQAEIETTKIKIGKLLCKFSTEHAMFVCALNCGLVEMQLENRVVTIYPREKHNILYGKRRMAMTMWQLEHHLNHFQNKVL